MSQAYTIRRAGTEHLEQLVALQQYLWGGGACRNRAYFRWKYLQDLYRDAPLIFVARQGGRIVGMRGFGGSGWEMGLPSESSSAPVTDDLVIHPEHRNRGLFSELMGAAFEYLAGRGHPFVLSLSANPVTVVAQLGAGFRRVTDIEPVAWKPTSVSLDARLRRWLKHRFSVKRAPTLSELDRWQHRRLGENGFPLRWSSSPRPEAMAELVERIGWDGRIRHRRDRRFFEWRFANPFHTYRFLFWEAGRLEGYLVLRWTMWEPSRAAIVDWEAIDGQVFSDLLQAAMATGSYEKLTAWRGALPSRAADGLHEAGFHPEKRQGAARYCPCVMVRALGDEHSKDILEIAGRSLLRPADWDMRMLYTMQG